MDIVLQRSCIVDKKHRIIHIQTVHAYDLWRYVLRHLIHVQRIHSPYISIRAVMRLSAAAHETSKSEGGPGRILRFERSKLEAVVHNEFVVRETWSVDTIYATRTVSEQDIIRGKW